jgi:NADPH:quinone reductase
MKAVRITEWEKTVQIEQLPQPSPANDEVLVRVHAVGVNPMEQAIAAGYAKALFTVPMQLGRDFAGEVVVVLDTVGGDMVERSFKVLKPGGR